MKRETYHKRITRIEGIQSILGTLFRRGDPQWEVVRVVGRMMITHSSTIKVS